VLKRVIRGPHGSSLICIRNSPVSAPFVIKSNILLAQKIVKTTSNIQLILCASLDGGCFCKRLSAGWVALALLFIFLWRIQLVAVSHLFTVQSNDDYVPSPSLQRPPVSTGYAPVSYEHKLLSVHVILITFARECERCVWPHLTHASTVDAWRRRFFFYFNTLLSKYELNQCSNKTGRV
jgi:hypothetical protein